MDPTTGRAEVLLPVLSKQIRSRTLAPQRGAGCDWSCGHVSPKFVVEEKLQTTQSTERPIFH